MREGAVGVRERGIYIKYWWDKGGLLVWDGVADSRTKKEEKKEEETKEMEFSATKKRLGRMFWVGHVSC